MRFTTFHLNANCVFQNDYFCKNQYESNKTQLSYWQRKFPFNFFFNALLACCWLILLNQTEIIDRRSHPFFTLICIIYRIKSKLLFYFFKLLTIYHHHVWIYDTFFSAKWFFYTPYKLCIRVESVYKSMKAYTVIQSLSKFFMFYGYSAMTGKMCKSTHNVSFTKKYK